MLPPPIGPSSELTHAGRPYELTLLVSTVLVLFLVSHFSFLFIPGGGLSWLPVSFLLQVKYTLSYHIVSYQSCDCPHFW